MTSSDRIAQIDIDAMARLVRAMEDATASLPGIRREFAKTMDRFSIDTDATYGLSGPATWALGELPGVRRRLALARNLEAGRPTWMTGPVYVDETRLADTDSESAREAGAAAARSLLEGTGRPDAELLAQIERNKNDPYFAAGFAAEASPTELAQIVTRLSAAVVPVEDSASVEENTATNAWYATLVSVMSSTVATATHSTGDLALPAGYADQWVDAITAELPTDPHGDGTGTGRPDQAAALGLLIGSGGAFESTFLTTLASGVSTYEQTYNAANGTKLWYARTSLAGTAGAGTAGTGIIDPATGQAVTDPLLAILSAVSRQPAAAANFLNPDSGGPSAQARATYLIEDRDWSGDDFDTIGALLDAGATAWHTSEAEPIHQRQSAWIASATVLHLAARDPGINGQRIGTAGLDSLGHLLAAYVSDIDAVAQGAREDPLAAPQDSANHISDMAAWQEGLPVGALFSRTDLNAVLSEVLTDEGAAQEVGESVQQLNVLRLTEGAQDFEANPDLTMSTPTTGSAALLGYVWGNLSNGLVAQGARIDAESQRYVTLATYLLGLVPAEGTLIPIITDQLLNTATTWLGDASDDDKSEADKAADATEAAMQLASQNLQIAAALSLLDSTHLEPETTMDENQQTYTWFTPEVDAADVLADPLLLDQFIGWIHTDSGPISGITTIMSKAFDDGRARS